MRDALMSAREWRYRPTEMLAVLDVGSLSEADRFLAQSLTLHDADLCPCGCGFYLDETSEQDGMHEVRSVTCGARAMLDQDEKDNPNKLPGELRYLVDLSTEDD